MDMHHARKATTEDVLRIMAELDEPFLWTIEIAEELGYKSRNSVRDKLEELHDRGHVDYRFGRSYIWWITDEGWDYLDGDGA